jgi:DNA repair exonuclease SbcCD ATPase subunit
MNEPASQTPRTDALELSDRSKVLLSHATLEKELNECDSLQARVKEQQELLKKYASLLHIVETSHLSTPIELAIAGAIMSDNERLEAFQARVKELEEQSNGFKETLELQREQIQQLIAICTVKDEALRKAKQSLSWSTPHGGPTCGGLVSIGEAQDWHDEANDAIDEALTNSPQAAKDLLDKLNTKHNALQKIWDEDEMGWLTTDGQKAIECGHCKGKNLDGDKDKIQHDDYCLQGVIYKALNI